MGSGKSVIGEKLSRKLEREFIDMDRVIEERESMKISEIFAQYGEDYFRRKEGELLREIGGRGNAVVSTGGGIVMAEKNWTILKEGVTIYLKISPEEAWKRLEKVEDRPLLLQKDRKQFICNLLRTRQPYYEKADFTVLNEGRRVEEVIEEIARIIRHAGN